MAFVQCSGLQKTYNVGDEEVKALDNVSLSVEKGDFIAICGPSGSGKSTLANVIGGLDQPDAGSVMVDGIDLAKAKDKQLSEYRNSHIGFVFQSFNLQAHESALENVISPLVIGGVGSKKERREKGQKALERVGLGDRAKHKPTQLSGGQRQRVAIARAMLKNAPLLLLDEATSALDAQSEHMVQAALEQAMTGRTTLVIAHRLATVQRADAIWVLEHGRLVEQGTHAELIARGGLYASLAALQFNASATADAL